MEWNQMIPEFDVFNLEESIHFYVDLIGFHIVYDRKEDKFAFLQLENVQIMIQEIDKELKHFIITYKIIFGFYDSIKCVLEIIESKEQEGSRS